MVLPVEAISSPKSIDLSPPRGFTFLEHEGAEMRLEHWWSIVASLALGSCVARGPKSEWTLGSADKDLSGANVHILRDAGIAGGARLVSVWLNGKKIGEVRGGGVVSGKSRLGSNHISARISAARYGVGGYGMTFYSKKGQEHYFIIGINPGLMKNAMMINEITEASWRSRVR